MKRKPKPKQVEYCGDNHDFFQVSENINYAVATLGGIGGVPAQKPPRFICRRCGKVIQL